MVHKPKHKVHSFRGLLADGGEDEIRLERQNANVAYRIVKFEILPNDPAGSAGEFTVKIYRESQTGSITATIDFTETDLLAAGFFSASNASQNYPLDAHVIFDNILFSRNIFVTAIDSDADSSINYYIEIEEVPVSASTLMQLKLGVARRLNLEQ